MANTIGGSKLFNPKPPAKGSFPLDHFGECKTVMQTYMSCLEKYDSNASECHDLAKEYMKCRMDKDLMTKEDMKYLGFHSETSESHSNFNKKNDTPLISNINNKSQ